jgi:hypothetical protein
MMYGFGDDPNVRLLFNSYLFEFLIFLGLTFCRVWSTKHLAKYFTLRVN